MKVILQFPRCSLVSNYFHSLTNGGSLPGSRVNPLTPFTSLWSSLGFFQLKILLTPSPSRISLFRYSFCTKANKIQSKHLQVLLPSQYNFIEKLTIFFKILKLKNELSVRPSFWPSSVGDTRNPASSSKGVVQIRIGRASFCGWSYRLGHCFNLGAWLKGISQGRLTALKPNTAKQKNTHILKVCGFFSSTWVSLSTSKGTIWGKWWFQLYLFIYYIYNPPSCGPWQQFPMCQILVWEWAWNLEIALSCLPSGFCQSLWLFREELKEKSSVYRAYREKGRGGVQGTFSPKAPATDFLQQAQNCNQSFKSKG